MKITIRLFAQLKELIQEQELVLETNAPLSCRDAAFHLGRQYPGVVRLLKQSALVRNGVFVKADTLLGPGDELALLPPVSGG